MNEFSLELENLSIYYQHRNIDLAQIEYALNSLICILTQSISSSSYCFNVLSNLKVKT